MGLYIAEIAERLGETSYRYNTEIHMWEYLTSDGKFRVSGVMADLNYEDGVRAIGMSGCAILFQHMEA